MPIYDFSCPKCNKVEKDVYAKTWDEEARCETCGTKMDKLPSTFKPDTFPADGIFFEHVSAEGKRFFSRQEIKDYAKKNDLEFDYLS